MKIRAFITHKKAEQFQDCQDRFSINCDTKSVAVSDGMSSAWQQKIWAEILTEEFVNNREWVPTLESVKDLSSTWISRVKNFIDELSKKETSPNIIYRNERNLAEGKSAGATLLGVRFEKQKWVCDVLGDSCLIFKKGGKYEFATSQDVEKFDNYPDYFDSRGDGKGIYKSFNGEISADNPCIFLVSDPFSDFLLESKKRDSIDEYIKELLTIDSHGKFENVVAEWREKGMHNDDSTLIIVEYDAKDEFNILVEDNLQELIEGKKELKEEILSIEKSINKNENIIENKSVLEEDFIKYCQKRVEDKANRHNYNGGVCKFQKIVSLFFSKKSLFQSFLEPIFKQIYSDFNITKK